MQRILIADSSDALLTQLYKVFCTEFDVLLCQDGESALEGLLTFQPDALILNLSLPYKDGLTVLQEAARIPPVSLIISTYMNGYIHKSLMDLGVGYIVQTPTANSLRVRLLDMLAQSSSLQESPLNAQVIYHLHTLRFSPHLDGYHHLCIGIPLYGMNPTQRLNKELYPEVARRCGLPDMRTVEHCIRTAIENAWKHRDAVVWAKYFPPDRNGRMHCPSNKVFISTIAQMLKY